MEKLFFDLISRVHGISDFIPQSGPEILPKPMEQNMHRAGSDAQFCSRSLDLDFLRGGEAFAKGAVFLGLTGGTIILLDAAMHPREKIEGPTLVEDPVGRFFFDWMTGVAMLGVFEVRLRNRHRQMNRATAAFHPILMTKMVDEMAFQSRQKVGAQFPFFWVRGEKTPVFQKAREERLSEILRVFPAVTGAAQESVNRPPIDRAKFLQGEVGIVGQ